MRMTGWAVAVAAGLSMGTVAWADEACDKLIEEYGEAQARWYEQFHEAPEGKDGETVPAVGVTKPPAIALVPKFRACAEKHAGKPAAIPALVWLINETAQVSLPKPKKGERPPAEWALARLTRDHADQVEIEASLRGLAFAAYSMDKAGLVRLYEKIIATNKDKKAQSHAMFNLASTLCHGSRSGDEAAQKADLKRSTDTFRRIIETYPKSKAAEWAEPYIYEIERLQIGMVAPEIVGKDADGKEVKLSQFRGQVVVLGFWGFR